MTGEAVQLFYFFFGMPAKLLGENMGAHSTGPENGLPKEERILVLQGGGALGAYQAGTYEELAAMGQMPHWVAGISIGAINAALIVGNPPELRVQRLHEFWQTVSAASPIWLPWIGRDVEQRSILNQAQAAMVLLFGLPGFFVPRWPPAPFQAAGSLGALSIYDTAPLRATLEQLVDFELLNSTATRLSVGAVNVRTGNFAYFDTALQRLDVRHIMASSALPPGFPPIEIDGEWYWDGGLISNTPLQYVLSQPGADCRLVFQVDVFPCEGPMPASLSGVVEREKDIRFSSRTRLNTSYALAGPVLAQAVRRLIAKLPPSFVGDPDVQALEAASHELAVTVVHLIHRGKRYETQSKDYEFSRLSMLEHWRAGRADMRHTLTHPNWLARTAPQEGVHVFDLTRKPKTEQSAKPA
ncbi:patatin-like phospholipase family protein [Massilia sp. BJB1822]|uniref:patatin-like phospholipase family protein n=1 Tax=Massilia sp. BJB1822 TaxID=2744470 RepID=UPI001E4995BF|nr:patatin-like phospholipase family protein [Massilia sp. BJB1822]